MAQRRIEYQGECFELSYERRKPLHIDIIESSSIPMILFLHGWGSNKDVMKIAFNQCFAEYEHIYLDMPGFGNSPNEKPLHTQDYAGIVCQFLIDINAPTTEDSIVVGHSFGGKVGVLCKPKELILLSSAGIRVPKSLKVRFKIMTAKIMGKLGLSKFNKIFRSSDVKTMNEGMYQTFKNVVDEVFSLEFSAYKGKTSIFWGKDDNVTPLFCGKKIAELMAKSRFFVLEGDHYFFLKQGAKVEQLYKEQV